MYYKAFYNGKSETIKADSLYAAKVKAIAVFRPAKSKQHMVSVHLMADKDKKTIKHTPLF